MLQQDPLLQQLCIAFGYAVRTEREHQNISQQQLGHMIGSGHARISDIEGGLVACSLEEVVRLCRDWRPHHANARMLMCACVHP